MSWHDIALYSLQVLIALAVVGAVGGVALVWLLNHPKD